MLTGDFPRTAQSIARQIGLRPLRHRNKPLWIVAGGALVLLVLVLAVSGLRDLFRFAQLEWQDYVVVVGVALLTVVISDAVKLIRR